MNLIEVGMVIKNCKGAEALITSVEKGVHGLLVTGEALTYGISFKAFVPWELPPIEATWPEKANWYGWLNRSFITVPIGEKGLRMGIVSKRREDKYPNTIQDYDTKMKETWDTIRKEEPDATDMW